MKDGKKELEIQVITEKDRLASTEIERSILEAEQLLKDISSKADILDYAVAVASGILCGMLDILLVGGLDLHRGRNIADTKAKEIVIKTAKLFGCEDNDLKSCVAFLEKKFPIPSDGNTPHFGGGLQHHLRDFAHHPTVLGLLFSLLTQFTERSYGTDVHGSFIVVPVPEKSRIFIGKDLADKLIKGIVIWFFHLVSDLAGSSSTAALSGGTGIPGPILSIAKELSVLPVFQNMKVCGESLPKFLSKLFNGTIFAKYDENGKIIKDTVIKFDLRGELGAVVELGRQALPVIANECMVRFFYFARRFLMELKEKEVQSMGDYKELNWNRIMPAKDPTLTRMLTIAAGVFTAVDVTEAIATQKYWVSVNYIGIGRFTVALGAETVQLLKVHDIRRVKAFYEKIGRNTYLDTDDKIYRRLGNAMDFDKFGLSLEQTEILYNMECLKTMNDIQKTKLVAGNDKIIQQKKEWLREWKNYMCLGFPGFVNNENAVLQWYDKEALVEKVEENLPEQPWLRLVLLEAMLFEPYYALGFEKNKKGQDVPSKKYKELQIPFVGYDESEGDRFLEELFQKNNISHKIYYQKGYIKRLRKCYHKVIRELNEVWKAAVKGIVVTAGVTIAAVLTAGMFAPTIAVVLVGSNFTGLSGAALTSACLAYLGGGAIAAGGMGMAGGTMVVVGGGAVLGLGVGAGVGGTVGAVGLLGKKAAIEQTAKLMVSVREIFLNDEHDLEYSNMVYEQYVKNIMDIEKGLVELRLKADTAGKEEKRVLNAQIKNTEESVKAMKIAMKSMNRFKSSFEFAQIR